MVGWLVGLHSPDWSVSAPVVKMGDETVVGIVKQKEVFHARGV